MINVEDNLIIYKDTTPMIPEGGFVKVVDKSSDDPDTFLVVNVMDLKIAEKKWGHDPKSLEIALLTDYSFWVKKGDFRKVSLEKPTFWQRIKEFFLG